MKESIIGVVLAGGRSRRMGGVEKGLLPLAGRPLLQHVVDRFSPQVNRLLINANAPAQRFAFCGLEVIADSVSGYLGPLAGVLAGLEWACEHAPDVRFIATTAADAPFIPQDLVARLDKARRQARADMACAVSNDRHHPVIGLWPVRLRHSLRRALVRDGVRRVDRWTDRYKLATAVFSCCPHDPFFNINQPQDMAQAQRLMDTEGGEER